MMVKYIFTTLVILVCGVLSVDAQIKIVFDMEKQQPIADVFVFIGNSSIGTTTIEDGSFQLDVSEELGQMLIFSHINYTNKRILINQDYLKADTIYLESLDESLTEVSISKKADPRLRKRRLARFTKAFLGESSYKGKVTISNSDKILFYEEDDKLFAQINEPIVVSNNQLGYDIKFYLEQFELLENDDLFIKGSAFFRDKEVSKKKLAKYKRNRRKLYSKTARNFFVNLVENNLKDSKYKIGDAYLNNESKFVDFRPIHLDSINLMINSDSIYRIGVRRYLTISLVDVPIYGSNIRASKGNLATGIKASGDIDYAYPTSYLSSKTHQILINKNGRIMNPLDIEEYGFWSEQRIADMLPDNFQNTISNR